MTADRIWGAVFFILGVSMAFASQSVPVIFPGSGDPGPRLMPLILGMAMAICGAILALRRPSRLSAEITEMVGGAQPETDPDNPNERVDPPTLWRRIALGGLLVAYVALFEFLGFSLASTIFLAGSMFLLGPLTVAEAAKKLAIALVVVVLVGLAMNMLLGLSVQGVWLS